MLKFSSCVLAMVCHPRCVTGVCNKWIPAIILRFSVKLLMLHSSR